MDTSDPSRSFPTCRHGEIVAHYEECLEVHGDNHLGVDWHNATDAHTRYEVMLDIVSPRDQRPVSLLDFGCGARHLWEYLLRTKLGSDYSYIGLDMSPRVVGLC